jgi:hypothetical protein
VELTRLLWDCMIVWLMYVRCRGGGCRHFGCVIVSKECQNPHQFLHMEAQ